MHFLKSACLSSNRKQCNKFIAPLGLLLRYVTSNPHAAIGTVAPYRYVAKVFQFHVRVFVRVLVLVLVCVSVLVHVLVRVLVGACVLVRVNLNTAL